MHQEDKKTIINRYESRLGKYGSGPQALGWFKGRQRFRFHFLLDMEDFKANDSILDVGCAYGDLEHFLRARDWRGEYEGVDIVPGLIVEGQKKYPHLNLRVQDIQEERPSKIYDWVVSSGALTSKTDNVDSYDHIQSMLRIMFGACRKGVSVNFVSPFIDYVSDVNFHPDLSKIIDIVSQLSIRFTIRHDYMPYEFTVYIYKSSDIETKANIFERHKDLYRDLKTD